MAVAQQLPQGSCQAGDRHLNFHETRDNLPTCWAAHTPEEQRVLLEELDLWVTWLVDHYSLDRRHVPQCWAEHWELVEELSALRLAWEGAYATTAHADAPLAWHEHLRLSRERLVDWGTGCRPGEHRL